MLPTTTYIYGSKRTLIHVDIIDNYQISNVAWVGMGGTIKYLDFCQDSRTPNRILAEQTVLVIIQNDWFYLGRYSDTLYILSTCSQLVNCESTHSE